MKTFKTLLATLAIAISGGALTSCNTHSGEDTGVQQFVEMVTLAATDENGSTFTYQYSEFSNLVTLTTPIRISADNVKVGQRLIIAYTVTDGREANTSGPINLMSMMQVQNGELKQGTKEDNGNWATSLYTMNRAWITGPWLNLSVSCTILQAPKKFEIVVDESTLEESFPTAYLIIESDNDKNGKYLNAYASFDIAWLWNNPKYNGMTLKYVDGTTLNWREQTFESRPGFKPAE